MVLTSQELWSELDTFGYESSQYEDSDESVASFETPLCVCVCVRARARVHVCVRV